MLLCKPSQAKWVHIDFFAISRARHLSLMEYENPPALCASPLAGLEQADQGIVTRRQHLQLEDACVALKVAEQQVERLYARWAELENKLQGNH